MNYSLPKYDKYRDWIRANRTIGKTWEELEFAGRGDDSGLNTFLDLQRDLNFWDINIADWKEIVQLEKLAEEQTLDIEITKQQAMICDVSEDNDVTIPTDRNSSWMLYKKHLLDNGFKHSTVEEIQKSSLKILKRLSNDTQDISSIKGLVIGNVQSGKTANMAALMAMAADWGWNMFIVLSGTIENLRKQTQNRLLQDLNHPGNLNWMGLEHLSKKSALGQRAQDLHFEDLSKQRYFTVCLKNASRLKNLIQWLQLDSNKQRQMKILIIDDEADQASINTGDVNSKDKERKTINKLIVNLVNGKNEKGQDISTNYKAMNYIGYTATPYANVLNEASEESLYPKNFITTLSVSPEYFGPQQIFGLEGSEHEGLDIIRYISDNDLDTIKDIHDGTIRKIPQQLENALCWFLCGAACMRIWNYKKPISMLIHTSQKQVHHDHIHHAIQQWLNNININDLLEKCRRLWKEETSRFTFEDFKEQYPNYGREDEEINKYPNFVSIAPEIKHILSKITNIPLGEDGQLSYHTGLHICVDNCSNNRVTDEGMYVRLAYPETKELPNKAPVFLVIGGSTLARGLTIEGLISTFFLRTVGQADTLMQMGRWFGYRKGYELLPRIWLTDKTIAQFKFLALLDDELRADIHELDTFNAEPRQYGPKVKNTPKYNFIKITAKNKMQSATTVELDFSGSFNQTIMFDNDPKILKDNIAIVEEFISKLDAPDRDKSCNPHAVNTMIWRNISYDLIDEMLQKYHFCSRGKVFNDIENVSKWIREMSKSGELGNWNIVISGKKQLDKNKCWNLPYGHIGKVTRTQKIDNTRTDCINIGVLREPKDLIVDIDLEGKNDSLKQKVKEFDGKDAKQLRALGGLESTPQLIIYMIDKESRAKKTSKRRKNLEAPEDIVGLCLNIPGRKQGVNYSKSIAIKLENINDELDLEDVYED